MKTIIISIFIIFSLNIHIKSDPNEYHIYYSQEKELSNEEPIEKNIHIFPNPVTGNKFSIQSGKKIKEIKLANILGQETKIEYQKKQNEIEVQLLDKKQGIYIVTILFEENTKEAYKIIIK